MSETDLEIVESPLPDEIVEESKEEEAKPDSEEQPPEEATGEEETSEEVSEEAAEEAEKPSEEEEPEKPKRKRRNLQKRISDLTQRRITAEQEAARLRQQLEAAKQPEISDEAPKQDDFKSYDDYLLAHAEYRSRKAVRDEVAALTQQVQNQQTEQEQIARAADWSLKVENAREQYDDYDEVVDRLDMPSTPAMIQAIQASENGTDIAYHLGQNPSLARELSTLPPMQAVIRIGQLSQKLREPVKPKPTAASPPIKTVKTSGTKPSNDPEKMTLNEYIKWRRGGGGK